MNYLRHFIASLIVVLLMQQAVTAQPPVSLIRADSSWGKETFQFPLSFAPELKYDGVEEARFPKGWAKKDSTAFWSYVFAWQLKTTHPLSKADLEKNLRLYFDGLMSAVAEVPKEKLPATKVLLQESKKTGGSRLLKGTVEIYDAFTLKEPLLLYVRIEQTYCSKNKTALLLFRFSPKPPDHLIWKQLNGLTILKELIYKNQCR